MQCTIAAAGLNLSAVLAVFLILTMAGAGWHFGRWLVWLATHRFGLH